MQWGLIYKKELHYGPKSWTYLLAIYFTVQEGKVSTFIKEIQKSPVQSPTYVTNLTVWSQVKKTKINK
jgi:hypothetical protein